MSSIDGTKATTKSGRRNKKADARRQKSNPAESSAAVQLKSPEVEQEQDPQPDPQPAVIEAVEAVIAKAMLAETEAVSAAAPLPADAPSPAEPAAAEPSPVSLQTIAQAYRDYTRKSFEEFGFFCEQLTGARSLDKAVEVQTEFVKRVYENSVAETQKLRELHREFARQTFEPLHGLVGRSLENPGQSQSPDAKTLR